MLSLVNKPSFLLYIFNKKNNCVVFPEDDVALLPGRYIQKDRWIILHFMLFPQKKFKIINQSTAADHHRHYYYY